jgi:predicted  nucleic acid-binding Zn-ribbon protein
METTLTQKLARQRLLQSQKRALLDEYMPIKEELETLEDEIEQLEEELQKIDDVQSDARLDELIKNLNEPAVKNGYIGKLEGVVNLSDEELLEYQRQPKAWSHADDENDGDR